MILSALLAELAQRGITVWAEDDRLRVRAPRGAINSDLRQELIQHKAELLTFLEARHQAPIFSLPLVPFSRERSLPLSPTQEELWFVDQLQDTSAFKVSFAYHLRNRVSLQALQWSIHEIVRRHEILRTTFTLIENRPAQVIQSDVSLPLKVIDVRTSPAHEQDMVVRQRLLEENARSFELAHGPLMRIHLFVLSETEQILHVATHHIIFDAWSIGLFIEELAALYSTACEQKPSPLAALPIQYADVALWQRQWLESDEIRLQLDYWKEQLANAPATLDIPLDRPRLARRTFQRRQQLFRFPSSLTDALRALSRSEGLTLYTTLLAGFQTLLYRYCGQKDIVIGSPTSGRLHPETKAMLGSFAYPLVMRTVFDDRWTVQDVLAKTRAVVLEAHAHQEVPFASVVEIAQPVRNPQYTPLFQVMFTFPPALEPVQLPDLELSPIADLLELTADYDLVLGMMGDPDTLTGRFIYNGDLFEEETIHQIQRHFLALLEAMTAEPQRPIADISFLSEKDGLHHAPYTRKGPDGETGRPCLHHWFEQQAAKTPQATAIILSTPERENRNFYTYSELNQRSNHLAHYLQRAGVEPERWVGVYMERSPEMIMSLLGVLKAGGAFVLLDPAEPLAGLSTVLAHGSMALLLTQKRFVARLSSQSCPVICIDDIVPPSMVTSPQAGQNPRNSTTGEQLAYVLPIANQAVLVEHRSFSSRLYQLLASMALTPADVVLQQATPGDIFLAEVFLPLISGAKVVLETADYSDALRQAIARQQATVVCCTRVDLEAILTAGEDRAELESLRYVLCAGEALNDFLVQSFYEQCPNAQLYHTYMLPEAPGCVSLYHCQTAERRHIVPVAFTAGLPLYLLDKRQKLVPKRVRGEIYVGGEGLARGYLHDQVNAERRFLTLTSPEIGQQRLFKTGDMGRLHHDGSLELGVPGARHVWLNGTRIDSALVEEVLYQADDVSEGVVLARKKQSGSSELVAYVVPARTFSKERIHKHMQALVPAGMLPASYVVLAALPLTLHGQVDEGMLAQLDVIDDALIRQLEERVQAVPGIKECAAVVQQSVGELSRLHIRDVFPVEEEQMQSVAGQGRGDQKLDQDSSIPAEYLERAISDGGLLDEEDLPTTLQETIERAALQPGTSHITYIDLEGTVGIQSYAQLLEEAERILTGLRKLGLRPQDSVIFQIERNDDFIAALWGCILGGMVPVPIAVASSYDVTNSVASKLLNAWKMFDQPVVVSSAAHVPVIRDMFERVEKKPIRCIAVDDLRNHARDQHWHQSQPEDMALIMLTSGSTGMPKGVVLSHRNLLCRAAGSRQMNHFSQQDVTLNWMPLDHVAGLIFFHLRDVFLGCQQIHAATALVLQDPLRWIEWLHQYRVTITFAPNFAYGLVNDRVEEMKQYRWDLTSVRCILNGAEAIVARTARRFLVLLQPFGLSTQAMYPAWGMSETSSGVVYSNTFSLETTSDDDTFVEVGTPLPGLALRIVDDQDCVVGETLVGRLQVRGLTVTGGYYHNPELNQQVFTRDGWFDTGDLGFLRNGRLSLTGRAKDVIIINSVNYYCHEIEAAVEMIGGVETSYTAACGVLVPGANTDRLAIFFHAPLIEGEALLDLLKEIRGVVVRNMGVNPEYLIPVAKEDIPKTEIGKIQRSQLKQRFEVGQFEHILKRLDILSGNVNTLPAWFYHRTWCPKAPRLNPRPLFAQGLLFLDCAGSGKLLYEQLRRHFERCICIESGPTFARIDAEHYRLDPANPEEYRLLFRSLAADQIYPDFICHLWTYEPGAEKQEAHLEDVNQAQTYGVFSLLYLVQAQAQEGNAKKCRFLVGSSSVQIVEPAEKVAYEHAPLLGLLGVIGQEMPWLDCCHVDLPLDTPERNAARLLNEMFTTQRDREVAYRADQRLIPLLLPADMLQEPQRAPLFKEGGMYLLSGGLGALGSEVARYLLKRYHAKLLLVGRTCIKDFAAHEKLFDDLCALGEDVLYVPVDVCNFDQLRQVVEERKATWHCQLDGIIHLAGVFNEIPLAEETRDTFADGLRAKVAGTVALHMLLMSPQPAGLFIHFSSVNATLGGFGTGAYAAANRFLEHFAAYQRTTCGIRSYCFSWSMWNNMGVSQGYQMKDLSSARGYCAIEPREGMLSFLAGLYHDYPSLIIGLDGSNPFIRRAIKSYAPRGQHLCVYFTTLIPPDDLASLQDYALTDRFGTLSPYTSIQLPELPILSTGEIDRQQLTTTGNQRRAASTTRVAPVTEIERTIAAIWQQVLQVENIGIHESFFELGGHSILLAQIHGKLQEALHRNFMLVELVKYPTIAALSKYLSQGADEGLSRQEKREHADARKVSLQQQRELRQKIRQAKYREEQ